MTIYPDDSGRKPNPNYVPPASTKKYVCSKNYKILCSKDCFHAKNIKEENKIWFDTIEEGVNYGCRPCKHCMQNIATIPSGSVITKEQAEALCEFAKTPLDIDEGLLDKFNSIPN